MLIKWSQILPASTLELGDKLTARAQAERDAGKDIYPPQNQIFRALALTPPQSVKVCLVGQDPYHGPDQANGLSFAVNPGIANPPSLNNIFKELTADTGCAWPSSGDLTPWAKQGVLLLNSSLTVERKKPNSHADWGWNNFTNEVILTCAKLPQPIVFILWGAYAMNIADNLALSSMITRCGNQANKVILKSSHPSPYSAASPCRGNPPFLGSRPFTTTNLLLAQMGSTPINWSLP